MKKNSESSARICVLTSDFDTPNLYDAYLKNKSVWTVLHCSANCDILSFLSVAGENEKQDPCQDNQGTMLVACPKGYR